MPDFSTGRYTLAVAGYDAKMAHVAPLTLFYWPWNTTAWALIFLAWLVLAAVLVRVDAGYTTGVLGAHAPGFLACAGLYALTQCEWSEYLEGVLMVAAAGLLLPSLIVVGWRVLRTGRFGFAAAWAPAATILVLGTLATFAEETFSPVQGLVGAAAAAAALAVPFLLAGWVARHSQSWKRIVPVFVAAWVVPVLVGIIVGMSAPDEWKMSIIGFGVVGFLIALPVVAMRWALRAGGGWRRPLAYLTFVWALYASVAMAFQDNLGRVGSVLTLAVVATGLACVLWHGQRWLRAVLLGLSLGLWGMALSEAAVLHSLLELRWAALCLPLVVWLMPALSARQRILRGCTWGVALGGLVIAGFVAAYVWELPLQDRENALSVEMVLGLVGAIYVATFLGLVRWNRWAAAVAEGRFFPKAKKPEETEHVPLGVLLGAH